MQYIISVNDSFREFESEGEAKTAAEQLAAEHSAEVRLYRLISAVTIVPKPVWKSTITGEAK